MNAAPAKNRNRARFNLRGRLALVLGAMGLCSVSLVGRAAYVQLINHDFYQRQGDARFLREIPIPTSRGMITDRNGEPPPDLEARQRGIETGFQIRQFAVDVDADALEAARGRMDLLAARHHRGDHGGQVGGAGERLGGAAGDDGARDAAALLLLAVGPQHVGDLAFVGAGDPCRCALAGLGVHAHVQRAILAEAETALGDVELGRGKTVAPDCPRHRAGPHRATVHPHRATGGIDC